MNKKTKQELCDIICKLSEEHKRACYAIIVGTSPKCKRRIGTTNISIMMSDCSDITFKLLQTYLNLVNDTIEPPREIPLNESSDPYHTELVDPLDVKKCGYNAQELKLLKHKRLDEIDQQNKI